MIRNCCTPIHYSWPYLPDIHLPLAFLVHQQLYRKKNDHKYYLSLVEGEFPEGFLPCFAGLLCAPEAARLAIYSN